VGKDREDALRRFAEDVRDFHMTVNLDSGLYRHLSFRHQKRGFDWFEIITWPWGLTFNGDHGCWSFSRIEDMFEFFSNGSRSLRINPGYWEEKLLAYDRHGPALKFDPDYFRQCLIESLDGYGSVEHSGEEFKKGLLEQFEDELGYLDSEHELRSAVESFEYSHEHEDYGTIKTFRFSDTWEIDGRKYTQPYLYALYAIVWAIQQYEEYKGGK
jgi:hypothetical protein